MPLSSPAEAETMTSLGTTAPPPPPGSPAAAPQASARLDSPGRSFADSLHLPLQAPLLQNVPRAWVPAASDAWVPRRSTRLAAKSAFHDPQPERQAKRVLLNKWTRRPDEMRSGTPDATIAAKFHDTFSEPLSSSKRAAMHELFPAKVGHGERAAARLF